MNPSHRIRQEQFSGKPMDCGQLRVDLLLDGDESQQGFQETAAHVEGCLRCQQRLTEMAGEPQQWEQVGELLRNYPDIDLGAIDASEIPWPGVVSSAPDQGRLEDHLRSLLEPPSHPEMLGRLGRYEMEGVIGSGGMGIVLRGFDTELHRPVAVKILAQHLAHSGAARQRFTRESRAAAAVVHEHVVSIHDVDVGGSTPFLVMQYVAGESLQSRVERDGPLSSKELLRIGVQAAMGLQAAHAQGVVHRDIKPANILLERGVERALVTDFGLARTVDDASLTHTGIVAGTPHYMSPEQALGQPTDTRTDLFSLGAVLYFMATGHPPFRAEKAMGVLNRICHEPHRPVWEINPELPDELSDVIDCLLAKKSSRRYASAAEVQQHLSRILSSLQQHQPRSFRRTKRWLRQHRRGLAGMGVAGISLAAAVLFAILPHDTASSRHSLPAAAEVDMNEPTVTSSRAIVSATTAEDNAIAVGAWPLREEMELATWQQAIQQLEQDLNQLQPSVYEQKSDQVWQREIDALSGRLDRMHEDSSLTFGKSL